MIIPLDDLYKIAFLIILIHISAYPHLDQHLISLEDIRSRIEALLDTCINWQRRLYLLQGQSIININTHISPVFYLLML